MTNHRPLVPSRIIDRRRLSAIVAENHDHYRTAAPFPYVAFDGLFEHSLLDAAVREMPTDEAVWATYNTRDEHKHVCSDVSKFGPTAEIIVHALNSAAFVDFLEKLTDIRGLISDPSLHAAGYMRVEPGGFLGLHTDFTTHEHFKLDRRINVLLYLNRDWRPEWGGHLELHSNDPANAPTHQKVAIEPVFNRMVIFNTPNALHGHPQPVACPPGRARLCLSWYYYTAPPTLGYFSRVKKVDFVGRRHNAGATLAHVANELVPPIIFRALRKLRDRRRKAYLPQ